VLDITPPTGFITLSDALFSPIEASPTITIGVNASSPVAKIDSWRMEIDDPENHLFKTFEAQWPTKSAVWDGKGFEGDLVLSAEDYPVVVKVRDEFGNVGELTSVVPVDILMVKTATGFRILSSRIFFKPYTADYQDVRPELAAQNMKRLADMATKLRKFSNYKITLVGHAVSVYWDNTARSAKEERDVLLPLSKARAEAVDKAMIDRGLNAARFTSKGVGDSDQLVPDSNLLDRWQNRRVAFFLDK
jgi:outer membrane protein OmpA-like peptidoglycan-associated protein